MKILSSFPGAWVMTALLVALWAAPLRADLEMTQEMESGGKTVRTVTRFKLDKKGKLGWVRVDQPGGIALITDFPKRRVIALSGETKVAVITKFRKVRKKLPDAAGAKIAAPVEGEEKVGEVMASLYEGTVLSAAGEAKMRLWVAKEHPQQALVVPLVQAYAESPVLKATAGLAESIRQMPGVVMKSVVEVGDYKVVTTLLSLQEKEIPMEVFEIPAGYRKETK